MFLLFEKRFFIKFCISSFIYFYNIINYLINCIIYLFKKQIFRIIFNKKVKKNIFLYFFSPCII